jgi:hypothetical protein
MNPTATTERFYTLGNGGFVEVASAPAFSYSEAFEAAKLALCPTLVASRAKRFGITEDEARAILAEHQADRAQEAANAAWRKTWFGA